MLLIPLHARDGDGGGGGGGAGAIEVGGGGGFEVDGGALDGVLVLVLKRATM